MIAQLLPFPGATRMPHGLALDALLSAIPSLPRPLLARLTARMIDRMDELDGDPDSEDDDPALCEAGDDGCAPLNCRGRIVWGYESDPDG